MDKYAKSPLLWIHPSTTERFWSLDHRTFSHLNAEQAMHTLANTIATSFPVSHRAAHAEPNSRPEPTYSKNAEYTRGTDTS